MEPINILSGEINARMSREMDTMMDFMQTQISRALSCAISERITPEMQNMVENLPSNHDGVEKKWFSHLYRKPASCNNLIWSLLCVINFDSSNNKGYVRSYHKGIFRNMGQEIFVKY